MDAWRDPPGAGSGPPLVGGTHRESAGTRPSLRLGIAGGGLIAQAIHLPTLRALDSMFTVAALADPSERVREALGARHAIPSLYGDHRALLEDGGLDALLVCAPNGRHAEIVLDALEAGLHVLAEKPLCLSVADADRIVARRDATRLVVQVGYMKRFDAAYEALLDDLPPEGLALRHVSTRTVDPGLARTFVPPGFAVASDIPAHELAALRRTTAEQVADAVGTDEPGAVAAFSEAFLGALVHDVNAVHGVLARARARGAEDAAADGEGGPEAADGEGGPEVADGEGGPGVADAYADAAGTLAGGAVALPGGGRWTMAWMLVPGAGEFREEIAVAAADGVRTLTFPAPYLRPSPATYRFERADGARCALRGARGFRDAYTAQLEHFHACITAGARCRTPPEQARADMVLLTALFRHQLEASGRLPQAAGVSA